MTTIFYHLDYVHCPDVMVKWSKKFYRDHSQNFKIAVVKWSELGKFQDPMGKFQDPWANSRIHGVDSRMSPPSPKKVKYSQNGQNQCQYQLPRK